MKTKELLPQLIENHLQFINFINSLTANDFEVEINAKWSAGQQLEHIVKCLEPLTQILASKQIIKEKFGKTEHPALPYEAHLQRYQEALRKGGKAPARFVPEKVSYHQKNDLVCRLKSQLNMLEEHLALYSEDELNTLALPHPLLGNIAIKEMLYNTAYHVTHHHQKMRENMLSK